MLLFAISWPQLCKTEFVKLIQVYGSNLILQQQREEMTLSNISVEKKNLHFFIPIKNSAALPKCHKGISVLVLWPLKIHLAQAQKKLNGDHLWKISTLLSKMDGSDGVESLLPKHLTCDVISP